MHRVLIHLIKLIVIFSIFDCSDVLSERISQKKCAEYAKLVYVDEAAPILRINPGNNVVSKCGIVETPLIVGGIKVKPREFPHMAIIGYGKKILWQCGGSIISENFILTAAHCVDSPNEGPAIKVRVGIINLNDAGSNMQERNVINRQKHPDYKLPSRYNDIALLTLDKPLDLNADVRPGCLEFELSPPGKHVIATGFGRTSYEADKGSNDLMKVTLDHIDPDVCKKYLEGDTGGKLMPQGLVSSIFCAGVLEGGKDTCQGDSGGPLQRVLSEPYCMYSILGITSFGKFCAFKNSPAVYTRVSSYLDWIEKIVWPKAI
ncbi:hypothetical protein PV325_006122 [Microctonus aethiopoides]|uniref:chymotrypsin n=1 Tax=Microctonus aethiopoides TaxID=144406 RepID=A0AA39C7G3_9HYME|nr:hypothetical protein PV325_006122 [Microctonus aethiopoides]KAK0099059.1 hypothetical protein PV326_008373 [Microctonus aethiopoides]KAK0159147.1 hypothetical protein PV328_010069 [Microctonus aethiopoides]